MTAPLAATRTYFTSTAGHWTIAGVLLLAFVLLAWPQRVPSLTTASDDATYVLLSRSILDGGYHSIHLVGAPIHTKYPPVFPLLLAGVSATAGESVDAFIVMNIAITVAGLALMFAAARHHTPPAVALGALAIGASSPFLQGSAGTVMSEPAFFAAIALTLWILTHRPLTNRRIALACACAVVVALTRTAGATLVLALIAWLMLERRRRAAAVFLGIITAVVLAVSLWLRARAMPDLAADYVTDALESSTQTAANPVGIVGRRMIVNAPQYAATLLWILSVPTIRGTVIDNALWLAIAAVAIGAGLWLFWRQWRIVTLFLVMYGALMLAWPWVSGRFLVPVLPLLAMTFLAGVHALFATWRPRLAITVVLGFAAIITLTGVLHSASRISARSRCDRAQPMRSRSCFNQDQLSFFAAARYVAESTPPGAVVMSSNEATFFYLAGRRLVPVDSINALPPARAAEFLQRENVSYAVLNHVAFDDVPLIARLTAACNHLDPVREFPPRTVVFRVVRDGSGGTRGCEMVRTYARGTGEFLPQMF